MPREVDGAYLVAAKYDAAALRDDGDPMTAETVETLIDEVERLQKELFLAHAENNRLALALAGMADRQAVALGKISNLRAKVQLLGMI